MSILYDSRFGQSCLQLLCQQSQLNMFSFTKIEITKLARQFSLISIYQKVIHTSQRECGQPVSNNHKFGLSSVTSLITFKVKNGNIISNNYKFYQKNFYQSHFLTNKQTNKFVNKLMIFKAL